MIKLFLTDMDGVLTDGGYYVTSVYTEPMEQFLRKFNTRDFVGINMLHEAGIQVGVLTGSSQCSDQQFERSAPYMDVFAGVQDKYEFVRSTFVENSSERLEWDEIAYIGDEINDAKLLEAVGLAACPNDAVYEVKRIIESKNFCEGFVLDRKGGDTCLREFVDIIRLMQNIPATWENWTFDSARYGDNRTVSSLYLFS